MKQHKTNNTTTAASTGVERSFSRGRLNVSRLRHSLSDETTRSATVLGSWATIPGLVPREELIANIRAKGPRWEAEAPKMPTRSEPEMVESESDNNDL